MEESTVIQKVQNIKLNGFEVLGSTIIDKRVYALLNNPYSRVLTSRKIGIPASLKGQLKGGSHQIFIEYPMDSEGVSTKRKIKGALVDTGVDGCDWFYISSDKKELV